MTINWQQHPQAKGLLEAYTDGPPVCPRHKQRSIWGWLYACCEEARIAEIQAQRQEAYLEGLRRGAAVARTHDCDHSHTHYCCTGRQKDRIADTIEAEAQGERR